MGNALRCKAPNSVRPGQWVRDNYARRGHRFRHRRPNRDCRPHYAGADAEKDGKISVQLSTCTDTVKVLRDQVLEVRNIGARLRIAKKARQYDEKDPYVPPYDPYGDGELFDGA